jgi:Flp pilus assembly protein TadG
MHNPPSGSDRGQTLVEFALILPIFVLVLVGLLDAGRAVYAFSTVQNASREAVRLAIVDQSVTAIKTAATDAAVGLGIPATDVNVAFREPDFATGGTGACSTSPSIGCVAEVRVTYKWTAATPIVGNLMGTIEMAGLTRQPIEFESVSP